MSVAKVSAHIPRLPTFSGDPNSKGDTTYDLWKYEVQCLDWYKFDMVTNYDNLRIEIRKIELESKQCKELQASHTTATKVKATTNMAVAPEVEKP